MSAQPLLEVRDLRVQFRANGHSVQAVDGISYRLFAGRTLAIIGESGCGKTVSCRALLQLLPESASVSGSARFGDTDLLTLSEAQIRRRRGADIAMVFQDPMRSLNPAMRVGHQIVEAIRQHQPHSGGEARRRAIELLDLLRVPAAARRFVAYPHELSGGLRQRVLIAMAIAGHPRLLIADEATRSLDVITQEETLSLLKDLQRTLGMALIMVSHDLRLTASFADDVLVMYAGRAVEYGPAARIFSHARMRYTRALLDAIPDITRVPHSRMPSTPGHPPELHALPSGCPFSPRCAGAGALCRETAPPFQELEPDHSWACWHPCERGEVA